MSTQIDLGPVLPILKGDWDATTTYERLNIVRHNSASWVCNVATSTGVEPEKDSTDWYLQVKDTSAVSSINGMTGDVVLTLNNAETPPAEDNSTRVATTEWVTAKNTTLETNLQSYVQEAIEEAEDSITQNANNNINAVIDNYLPLTGGTLTGDLTGVRYTQKMSDVDVTAIPISDIYSQPIIFTDKNDKTFAYMQAAQWTDGSNILRFVVSTKDGTQGPVLTLQERVDGTTVFTLDGENVVTAAGTGLTQSTNTLSLATVVTAGNAGPTSNDFPAHGGTFTVPYITYDAYGRVTGGTNRTITLPAAPTSVATATKATTTPNVAVGSNSTVYGCTISSNNYVLPSGGTWRCVYMKTSGGINSVKQVAGGTKLPMMISGGSNNSPASLIAIRSA